MHVLVNIHGKRSNRLFRFSSVVNYVYIEKYIIMRKEVALLLSFIAENSFFCMVLKIPFMLIDISYHRHEFDFKKSNNFSVNSFSDRQKMKL